jgi:hypothetical protein
VDQYVEAVATGAGPAASPAKATRTPLPPEAKNKLEQASPTTARALETIAASSRYGAPGTEIRRSGIDPRSAEDAASAVTVRAALESSVTAVATTSDTRLLGLLLVLLATTVGALALAVREARA